MKICSIFGTPLGLAILGMCWARAINDENTGIEHRHDGRIVGGQIVDISAHPHQVSMRLKDVLKPKNGYEHDCGGSIITERIILTAAHCVIGKVASQYKVVAGANYRRSGDGVIVPVKELIMHEQYNPSTINNDIALAVLAAPLPINNYTIKTVELAEDSVKKGAIATLAGWGTISFQGNSSSYLQEVKVSVLSNAECNEDYAGRITDAMFCAGLRGVGGKDACQNDSGGPLLVNGRVAGVVSWGIGCAFPQYPGVYTNVPYFRPWLREKIAQIETSLRT
ncbi:trypsin zeta-like [Eurosta solidaginis]|uniref:trypsin zeta-like n=1 Tax=Eurosta solidaginis TaxID=178769 RepID=UPI0035310799